MKIYTLGGIFRIVIKVIPIYWESNGCMRRFPRVWVNEADGHFLEVKPAAIRVAMLEGAVVEVKAVYIDAHSGFVHSGRFLPAS
jgi:hypothetical protein